MLSTFYQSTLHLSFCFIESGPHAAQVGLSICVSIIVGMNIWSSAPVPKAGTTSTHHYSRCFFGVYFSSLSRAISRGGWCILVESLILEPWYWHWRSHSGGWHGQFVAENDIYVLIHTCLYIYPWGHIVCLHGNLRTRITNSSFNQYHNTSLPWETSFL